jgi:hypothetical protein
MKHSSLFPPLAVALSLACTNQPSGIGQLSAKLSSAPSALATADAPLPGVEAIRVNVTAVRAHSVEAGWLTLSTTPVTVDLLAIADAGVDLGLANLPAGTVTQLRLVVAPDGNVVVKEGGVEAPLKVPSGSESGIKIIGPWTVDACEETSLTLELDGHRSIWAHSTGAGEEWNLRPVIRTVAVEEPGTCEPPAACVPAECRSGLCETSGDQCAPGGTSTTCAADADCLSNACVEGACAPGEDGAPCREPADCLTGSICNSDTGICSPAAPPM